MKHFALAQEIILRFGQIILGRPVFDFPLLFPIRNLFYRIISLGRGSVQIGSRCYFVRPHVTQRNDGKIYLGKNVAISRNVEIDYSGGITIEDDVWISQNVLIETHEHAVDRKPKSEWKKVYTSLTIGSDAWIGANVIILPKVKVIGKGAIIGAGSVVTKDVEPMSIIAGVPAKKIATR